jgi:hypothetical protein
MALLRPYAIYTIGAQRTGELEFVALFSKPSKEEPIAWSVNKKKNLFLSYYIYIIYIIIIYIYCRPVVRVYLSLQNIYM